MRRPTLSPDLVLGMTLAEIFLLLMLVGWYGSRLESEAASAEEAKPEAVLMRELEQAKRAILTKDEEIQELSRNIANYRRLLEWLGIETHYGRPPATEQEITDALKGAKRGKAACAQSNVLVEIEADTGTTKLIFQEAFDFEGSSLSPGQPLVAPGDIDQFLLKLRQYYLTQREQGKDCVFDYSLAWRTDRDYRVAKQRFEKFFYPAGEREIR